MGSIETVAMMLPWQQYYITQLTNPFDCPFVLFSYILRALIVENPILLKAAMMSWSVVHCRGEKLQVTSNGVCSCERGH